MGMQKVKTPINPFKSFSVLRKNPYWGNPFGSAYLDLYFETYSAYSLTPIPAHEATGVVLFPTLSWTVD